MLGVLLRLRRAGGLVLRGRTDGRLRATWRVAVPILLAFVGITALGPAVVRTADAGALGQAITGHLLSAAVVTGVLVLSARVLDDRNVTDYGLDVDRRWVLEFAGGAALGTALVGATLVVGYLAGWVRVVETFSSGDAGALVPWLALFAVGWLCVGYWEEVLFRGIFITNAVEGLSARSLSPPGDPGQRLARQRRRLRCRTRAVRQRSRPGEPGLEAGLLGADGRVARPRLRHHGPARAPDGLHAAYDLAANNVFYAVPAEGVLLPTLVRSEIVAGGLLNPTAGIPGVLVVLCGYVVLAGWWHLGDGDLEVPRSRTTGPSGTAD